MNPPTKKLEIKNGQDIVFFRKCKRTSQHGTKNVKTHNKTRNVKTHNKTIQTTFFIK